MSAQGAVLFRSGQVAWFEMHTICSGWYSTVYASYEESRKHWHDKPPRMECRCGPKQRIELVQIAEFCGDDHGWFWPGIACGNCLQFLGPCSFEGQDEVIYEFKQNDLPYWAKKEIWRVTHAENSGDKSALPGAV